MSPGAPQQCCCQSCEASRDATLSGFDSGLVLTCLVNYAVIDMVPIEPFKDYTAAQSGAVKFPFGTTLGSINGTYTIDYYSQSAPTCYFMDAPTTNTSEDGVYYANTDCTGSTQATFGEVPESLLIEIAENSSTGKITRVRVFMYLVTSGVGSMAVLLFDSGSVSADLGDSISNNLYGGIGSVVITAS